MEINSKLNDQSFLETAVQSTATEAAASKGTTDVCNIDTTAAWCAYYRFPDVQIIDGLSEANGVNKITNFCNEKSWQSRNYQCADRISKQQSWCYLSRYPDLQTAFGTKYNSWKKAQNHWETHGYAEGRDYTCEGAAATWCTDEDGGACNCRGQVHFGPLKNSDDAAQNKSMSKATLQEMLQWNSVEVDGKDGSDIECTASTFGNPIDGLKGQCICEPPARHVPIKIADEGDNKALKCEGNVFYTEKESGGVDLNFDDAIANAYFVMPRKKAEKGFKCNNNDMGVDPVPGYTKTCWCDRDIN